MISSFEWTIPDGDPVPGSTEPDLEAIKQRWQHVEWFMDIDPQGNAGVWKDTEQFHLVAECGDVEDERSIEDATLIEQAPKDIRYLFGVIAELQGKLKSAQADIDPALLTTIRFIIAGERKDMPVFQGEHDLDLLEECVKREWAMAVSAKDTWYYLSTEAGRKAAGVI